MTAVPAAAAPNDGTVAGQVVNNSAGGSSTGGTTVLLVAFGRQEQAPVGQQTTQSDTQGNYVFSGLDRDPNLVYITLARYQNVNYPASQPFQLQEQPSVKADIAVFESVSTDESIQLERLNLLVMGAQDGVVQFMEMGALVNTSDRTFVTANPQDGALARAIKFALPPGALGVQMQTGFNNQDVTSGMGGVQVTSPIPPGRHEFALSFQVPYSGSTADVSLQMPYATTTYSVYLPDTGVQLDANGLVAGGPTQLGGQSYALYSASNLPRSTMIGATIKLSNGPGGGLVSPTQLALISLGVVLFVLGGGVLLFGSRLRPVLSSAEQRLTGEADTERLELVVRLAALDERFASGGLSQAEYDVERDRGKQRLRELTLARRQATPSGV
ncbi:MAG TPA: hypothetical protein VGQ62_13680 [Chloroflexota bacterium]|nr:hypothetical protein [Chloroflexota bacterium]